MAPTPPTPPIPQTPSPAAARPSSPPSFGVSSSKKKKHSAFVFPWRMLIITMVVLGLSILIWAGMQFGYVPYLNGQITNVDQQFTKLSSSLDANQREGFVQFYSQLYNIDTLSHAHVFGSNTFSFLETNTYPTTLITTLRAQVPQAQLKIDGITTDYSALTNQLDAYRSAPHVLSVGLDSSRLRDATEGGGVSFSITVLFDGSFFSTASQ
jgi:hypothetical protein